MTSSVLASVFLLGASVLNRTLLLSYLYRVTNSSSSPHAPVFATLELVAVLLFSIALSYASNKDSTSTYSIAHVGPALLLSVTVLLSHALFTSTPSPVSVPCTILSVAVGILVVKARSTYSGDTQLRSLFTMVIAISAGVLGTVVLYTPVLNFTSFLIILLACTLPSVQVRSTNLASLISWRPLGIAAGINAFVSVFMGFQEQSVVPSPSLNGFLLAVNAVVAAYAIHSISPVSHSSYTSCVLISGTLLALGVDGIPYDALLIHPIFGKMVLPLIVVPSVAILWIILRAGSGLGPSETFWEYDEIGKDSQPMVAFTQISSPKHHALDVSDSDSNDQHELVRGGVAKSSKKRKPSANGGHEARLDKVRTAPAASGFGWITAMGMLSGIILASILSQHVYVPAIPGADPCSNILFNQNQPQLSNGTHVLVTGGAGFIGSNLAEMLLGLGYKVRVLDNLATGSFANIVHLQGNPNFEFVIGDIMVKHDVEMAMEGIEYVYHLAAMSKVVPSLQDPKMAKYCMDNNAGGSFTILDVCRSKRDKSVKKVIYAASSTYYGNGALAMHENDRPDLLTPYASSKYEGEIQMDLFDKIFKFPTVSIRFFMVYGPRQPTTGAYAIVTGVFVNKLQANKTLPIEGDGTHFRDFIHVRDIGASLILAQQSDLHSMVINSGTGVGHSVHEVADLVSPNQVHVAPRPHDLVGTLANTCRAKALLGFKAKYDFVTEMSSMIADAKNPERVTGRPEFKELVLDLSPSPWLLPTNSLYQMFVAHVNDLASAAQAATDTPSYVHHHDKQKKLVVVIPFTKKTRVLVENTYYTLTKHGQSRNILLVALTADDVPECMSMNTACYNADGTSISRIIAKLLRGGWTVHVSQPGTAYLRNVWPTVTAFFERTGAVLIVPDNAHGGSKMQQYTATPGSAALFEALGNAKSDADMYDAYENNVSVCRTVSECGAITKLKSRTAVALFTAPYKCLEYSTDKVPTPELLCTPKWAHVFYVDPACVEGPASVVVSALAKVKSWFMAFNTCPEMAETCLGIPLPMLHKPDPWEGSAKCLSHPAELTTSSVKS